MAEFDNADGAGRAPTEQARLAGYRKMDAYSPIPIEELNEALGLQRTRLPLLVLLGGIARRPRRLQPRGWASVIAYPMNIGGRPYHQLAAVHPGDVRDDGARRGADLLHRHVGAQQAAAAVSPGVQRAGVRRAPRPTGSSCASKPPIRGSIAHGDAQQFLEGLHPVGVSEVAP